MGAAESARGPEDGAPPVGPEDGSGEAEARAESVAAGEAGAEQAGADKSEPAVEERESARWSLAERRLSRLERRRKKIREEIERNRRGEYKVPTWVLAVALIAFIAGWVAMVVFS